MGSPTDEWAPEPPGLNGSPGPRPPAPSLTAPEGLTEPGTSPNIKQFVPPRKDLFFSV